MQRLRARFVPESVEIVSALEASGADVVTLCNSGSLFGDARLVVVTDVDGQKKDPSRPATGGWKAADVEAVATLPRRTRARHRARARRARGEEGRPDREGVREERRPADLRRRQARPGRLGRRALPAGRRQGRGGRVRAPDRVRRRGRSPRARERDRQDRDLGAGRAGRRGGDRAARLAARRRAVVRAHRRLGRSPSRAPARPVGDALRPLRQAAARHGAPARGDRSTATSRGCGS